MLVGQGVGISVVGIAYAFVQYVISRGDKTALEKAKQSLTWSIIAMLVVFFAVVAKRILFSLVGVQGNVNSETQTF